MWRSEFLKYKVYVSWSDKGRSRASEICCMDREDADLISSLLVNHQKELPYKLWEITIFNEKGYDVACPFPCRGSYED